MPIHPQKTELTVHLSLAQARCHHTDGMDLFRLHDWTLVGGVHGLYGDSGSGKTLLLNHLAGHTPNAEGLHFPPPTIILHTPDPVQWGSATWHDHVFHEDPHHPQWDDVTARDTLARLLDTKALALSPAKARAQAFLFDGFGLLPHLDKPLFMLSTGSRRKVFLTAALLAPQPLVLLDEPTAALDLRSIHTLWYALAVRNRLAQQITLVATASTPDELPHAGWRGHWSLA